MTVFGSAFPESDFEKSAFGERSDLQMIKTTYHHRFLENRISNAFLTEKCFSLVEVLNFKVILLFQSTIKEKIV